MLGDLPQPLLSKIAATVLESADSLDDVVLLSQVSSAFRSAVRDDRMYATHMQKRWGPLKFGDSVFLQNKCQKDAIGWRRLHAELESELASLLSRSIRKAVAWLHSNKLLSGDSDTSDPSEAHQWLMWLLNDADLVLRRRVVHYICESSEFFPKRYLDRLIGQFRFSPLPEETSELGEQDAVGPLATLRRVLLQFPFLPIDAGSGADRIIGSIARVYLNSVPQAAAWFGVCDKQVVEAAHLVIYALIVLNTDLHNPAVNPKMSQAEFAASLSRIELLRGLRRGHIERMYEALRSEPLRIDPDRVGVDTIVRSATDGDDEVTRAVFSRWHPTSAQRKCASVCASLKHRASQCKSRSGRRDLAFLFKRWQGQHFAELRAMSLLIIAVVVYCEWRNMDSLADMGKWNHFSIGVPMLRTLLIALVLDWASRA